MADLMDTLAPRHARQSMACLTRTDLHCGSPASTCSTSLRLDNPPCRSAMHTETRLCVYLHACICSAVGNLEAEFARSNYMRAHHRQRRALPIVTSSTLCIAFSHIHGANGLVQLLPNWLHDSTYRSSYILLCARTAATGSACRLLHL